MQITLKIEVQDNVLETLNFLASALAHANGMENTVKALEEIKTEKTEKTEPVKEETKTSVSQSYTREDVRSEFVRKNSTSNRKALKNILDKYEAENISTLDEKHFDAVMKDLGDL